MANRTHTSRRRFLEQGGVAALGTFILPASALAEDSPAQDKPAAGGAMKPAERKTAEPKAAEPKPAGAPADNKPAQAGPATPVPGKEASPSTGGKTVQQGDLMAPQALPDVVQGDPSAPITIVEYASMTCSHCARFHATTYPALKAKYIDTKKVKFILREFPLDPLATAGFMLARCAGNDQKRTDMVDLLFDKQQSWAFVDKPADALLELVKQAGFTKQKFDSCLDDKTLFDNINKVREKGDGFGVDATPTFFVNGKKVSGEVSIAEFDKLLQSLSKT